MKTKRNQTTSKGKDVQSVPADIMRPRILFILTVFVLTLFGLVMIYSSSSVLALGSEQYGNNPNFFIKKQLVSLAIALVMSLTVMAIDYRKIGIHTIRLIAYVLIVVLGVTFISGVKVLGASRWIVIPGIGLQLQPSEFVKPYLVLAAAFIIKEMQETGSDITSFVSDIVLCLLVPMFLIFIQPDKGTTVVILITVFFMLAYSGIINKRLVLLCIGAGAIFILLAGIYSLFIKQGYGSIRIKAFLNPWAYKDDEAYQIVQGYYAFASGGVFGKGVGFSSQKYAYLPMAYNDFIYAIVGEEFGLVGTLGVLAAFFYFYKVSNQIANMEQNIYGKLVVIGASVMIVFQFLLNVVGVVGLFPSSGKPIPFISYGGSSIMGTFILVGMILNVSIRTTLPQTRYDRRRSQLSVIEGGDASHPSSKGFRVIEGAGDPQVRSRRGRPQSAVSPTTTSRANRRGANLQQDAVRGGRGDRSSRRGGRSASRGSRR